MKYEIYVDLPEEVLKKYKPVAIRHAKDGDIIAWMDGEVMLVDASDKWLNRVFPHVIFEPIKQYREPVLPADAGKLCEFSDDGIVWTGPHELKGYFCGNKKPWQSMSYNYHLHARIEVPNETA